MKPRSYENEILTGCILTKDNLCFMLNIRYGVTQRPENYEGVRFYWTPTDLEKLRAELLALDFNPSNVTERDYGQSEFFLTDTDGFEHCFGVATSA